MPGLIVHEWIAPSGGSENVVDRFAELFPDAHILSLWNDAPGRYSQGRVKETWLASTPLRRSKPAALPFMPLTWRGRREEADWLLVSSHLFAHHVELARRDVPKLLYVHTPARYIWTPEFDARGRSPIARAFAAALKPLDARRAREATSVVANSKFVASRIQDAWGLDARVIYPPVEVEQIQAVSDWGSMLTDEERQTIDSLPSVFLLGASRLIPYKRLDLVIRAGGAADIPVVIAGSGPSAADLRKLADETGIPTTFIERPSNRLLFALYQRALVFVFPAIEDFGIMPVEAMAAGTPVVVSPLGGAQESVRAPVGGAAFVSERPVDLRAAVLEAASRDRRAVAANAREFDRTVFDQKILDWVGEHVA